MSKYAIIQLSGKQFKVSEGDTLIVQNHVSEEKTLTVSDVLLVSDGKTTTVGTPIIDKASVKLEVIEKGRGPKIAVRTYRNKSRYRRHQGHRQDQTVLKVTNISA